MKPKNQRLFGIVAVAVIAGAAVGAAGYSLLSRTKITPEPNSAFIAPVSTTSSFIVGPGLGASSTASSTMPGGLPAAVDMSNWKTYSNYELGFSIQYPPDLQVDTSNPTAFTLNFPSSYFSTQMADSDSFSVTVSATCTPEQSYDVRGDTSSGQTVTINNVSFIENTQEGIGAGNYDRATIYQANQNDSCYTVEFHSHAPDSGGLYADDPAQIASLETAHTNDEANMNAIVSGMFSTFTFINTPAGQNEAAYSSSQSSLQANPSGLINLASVSTSTFSVGASLTLTGSGFSGHDTIVWISNGSVQGVLWGGMPSSDTSITATVPNRVCTQYTGASGLACPSYLILSTGVYTVSVANQNGTTDPLYIRVQ